MVGTAYLLGAASIALWTFAGNAFGEMFSLAMNAVGFVACGMVWNASRVFHGRNPNLPGLFLGAVAWVAVAMTLPPEAAEMRLTIGAGIVAVYAALTAAELWSERRRTMQSRWPAIAVPVAHGFALMLPILLGNLFHLNAGMYSGSIWVTIFSVELMLYAIGTVFVIFILVSERTVTVHKTAASMDPLTGMFNRRGFAEATSRVIEREATAGRPVTVLIFDIDHFKSINDRFGHPAGDEVLMRVAALLLGEMRGQDVVVRTGGEEFVLLMPQTDANAAATACERLRAAIRDEPWDRIAPGMTLTASIGVATAETAGDLRALTEIADQRLYEAKRAGRDRVVA
jgi:diguanylate cyclase (GGDEF)-like protein